MGDDFIVAHGIIYHPDQLPGFAAEDLHGNVVGLATYLIKSPSCELVTINADKQECGIGTTLLSAVIAAATKVGCIHSWLTTTNDNVGALAFYQKHGYHLVAVHRTVLEQSRKLQPSLPLFASNGIPLRDEIELKTNLVL